MFNKILRFQDTDRRQGHRPLSRNSSCPQKTRHTPDTKVNEPNLRTLTSVYLANKADNMPTVIQRSQCFIADGPDQHKVEKDAKYMVTMYLLQP